MRAHLAYGLHQVGKPFERVVLALHRNEHAVGRAKAVQGQQRERGWTIEKNEVVLVDNLGDGRSHLGQCFRKRIFEPRLALGEIYQLDFRARQLAVRRNQVETPARRRESHVLDFCNTKQYVVNCGSERSLINPGAHGRIALRIEVDQQHAAFHRHQARGEIDAGRRLADAAFLIGDRNDLRHWRRVRCGRGNVGRSVPGRRGCRPP